MNWLRGALVSAALGGLALAAACSSDESEPAPAVTADAGNDAAPDTGAPPSSVPTYGPAASTRLTPYPSNRYTVADANTATGLRVKLGSANTADEIILAYPVTVDELNEMDGFSTTGGVVVSFSSPIAPEGIAVPEADPPITDPVRDARDYTKPDSPFYLVDIDPASPDFGKALPLSPSWWEQAKDDFFLNDEFTLIAQPAAPLRPATTYAFVVTTRLKAKDGTPVGRDTAFQRLLDDPADDYERSVGAALSIVETEQGVAPAEVAVATVFTTASVLSGVIEMGKARRAAAVPALSAPWSIETPKTANDPRVRFRAAYPAPEYRKAKPDGRWEYEASGAPKIQSMLDLEVFLAFSDATKGGKRPVVIYGHGLGGDKDGCWGTSERLSGVDPNGVAVFAIDSPEHGSRTSAQTTLISSVYGFFGIDPATNEFVIGRARDNFRQMAGDQLELVRLINSLATLDLLPLDANGDPAPDGEPDLDVSRILYIGHSFGSVQGPSVMALAPEITQATWNVGGAGLMMLLRDSNTFRLVVEGLAPAGTPYGSVARFMAITQAIVDPGDPLNFARYTTLEALPGVNNWSARDVLLQEVVRDTIVPNSTSEAVARAAGLMQLNEVTDISGVDPISGTVSGNLPSGATGVIAQFDKMDGDKIATHGSLIFAAEAQAQYVEFFKSGVANPHASVAPPYP